MKKILIYITMLLLTGSFVYSYYNNNMNANAVTYGSGGSGTARIHMAPAGISGSKIGLQKGDKLLMKDGLAMQLIYRDANYTDYISGDTTKDDPMMLGLLPSEVVSVSTAPQQGSPVSAWFSMATTSIANVTPTNGEAYRVRVGSYTYFPYGESNIAAAISDLNSSFASERGMELLENINLGVLRYAFTDSGVGVEYEPNASDKLTMKTSMEKGKKFFCPFQVNTSKYDSLIPKEDWMFSSNYWNTRGFNNSKQPANTNYNGWNYYGMNGMNAHVANSVTSYGAVRPAAYINTDNVVFAITPTSGSGSFTTINEQAPLTAYSSLWSATANWGEMKVRLLNSSIKANLKKIQNKKGVELTKVAKDGSVDLLVDANAGTGKDGNPHTISVLVFQYNTFKFYKPLTVTKNGSNTYTLNTTGMPIGKYKIAVVNETYSGDGVPAESSLISGLKDLEIVTPHEIQYTKTPQPGATKGDYEYGKNVKSGNVIGKITLNPTGVTPITYEISTNGDSTFNNFEIDGLDADQASSATNLNVKIKSNAPDLANGSLKAGSYSFCINSTDAAGYPKQQIEGKTKVCTSFTVEKTDLKIAFDKEETTKKDLDEAASPWNETATADPDEGVKITYTITGGDIGLIEIDEETGEITYIGDGEYGKVKIQATADDDPDSDDDNYNSASVEKEIVIIKKVNGVVIPDEASEDKTVPTFSTDKANVKTGGVIGKIEGCEGTPDNVGSGNDTITYSYAMKSGGNASFFEVDSTTGVIKTKANLSVGTYKFSITVSDKWSSKDIEVTVNVGIAAAEELKFYEDKSSEKVITQKSVSLTDTNVSVFATVKNSTNNNPVTYKIKDGSTNVIVINANSGAVTIKGVGKVIIVAEKKGKNGQADASAELEFTVTAGAQEFIYTDNAGNELPKQADKYKAYEEVYKKDKTFQLYTAGNPTGSTVTYQLKSGSPTDVISVDSDGLVHILNASISPSQIGKVIVEATSHDPSGNYADKTIELPINIKKANQTISFADVTYVSNGKGKVTPVIKEQDISSNAGGTEVKDTDYFITVDSSVSSSVAWSNDGIEVEYDYEGEEGTDIPLHVEKQGNRNYNKAEADGILHIMGPDESMLAVSSPGKIVYGDHFTIRSLQDDSSSTNVQYTFEVDDTTYISNPTEKGNKAEFDALKYSGTTTIKIKVTRTADGETPLSKTVTVQVLPKPIEIKIDNKEKWKGEENPPLTYQDFKKQLVSWNGVQDEIQEKDIKLNTTAKTNSNAGNYPIKGDVSTLNRTYPNYSFKFNEGTLAIKEENIEDEWYHLELDDGNNTAYTREWTNQDVNIISEHNEYINMSLDQSTWEPNQVTVTREGETNQSFWMKKDSGAITKEKQEIIKIDRTAPKVKGIKAKDTNNKLQDIINKISGGIFFKPGTAFEITTDDSKDNLKVSGTKEIAYKVYKITDETEEQIKDGTLSVTNEKAKITISETVGKYKVCVIPSDNAGNTGTESCHEVALKKIDVDVDGDGIPDFNDPDGDGCPDLNIKWKDPNTNQWIVINGDRNNDGIPDLNIDSDGDGKPDLNIDTDNDGKPDLNLVILKKSDWKPTKCVQIDIDNGILEEYCTGTSVKAAINVDTDNDGIPNINIDNKGDFKPHINIAKDGETPTINLVEIHEWKPKKDYKTGKFTYDSIGKNDIKPEINIDSDGDGFPDVNIDLDDDGEPDINIDVDGDGIPDIDIDSTGDGIPDVNVDNDGDGKPDENIIEITEWKPGKNVEGDLPYDTMDFSNPNDPDDDNDTSVKGQYNPATSMGGANTGDSTNIMIYIGISLLSVSLLLYLSFKYKTE